MNIMDLPLHGGGRKFAIGETAYISGKAWYNGHSVTRHNFEIGDRVTILSDQDSDGDYRCERVWDGKINYVPPRDLSDKEPK